MPENEHVVTTQDVKDMLVTFRGQEISLDRIRKELQIERGTKSFDVVRNIIFQLTEQKVLRYISRGNYKVVTPAVPVSVFGQSRERRPIYELIFPLLLTPPTTTRSPSLIVMLLAKSISIPVSKSRGNISSYIGLRSLL